MTPCNSTGCTAAATAAPRICIPALGFPEESHKPATIVVSLPLCPEHLAEFKKEDILQDALKESFRTRFKEIGKAPPDFDRAYVIGCPLDHKDYLTLMARSDARKAALLAQAVGMPPTTAPEPKERLTKRQRRRLVGKGGSRGL